MKNSKLIMVCVLSLLMTGALNSLQAQDREGNRREMREKRGQGRGDRLSAIPDLTEEQREKIKDLGAGMQKESLPLKNELREKRARLKTLSTAENANMNDINRVIDEIGDLQTKMMKIRAAHHQDVRAELNEEQRLFFDTHMGQGKHHRRHRRMDG